jgi:hypothetical protein
MIFPCPQAKSNQHDGDTCTIKIWKLLTLNYYDICRTKWHTTALGWRTVIQLSLSYNATPTKCHNSLIRPLSPNATTLLSDHSLQWSHLSYQATHNNGHIPLIMPLPPMVTPFLSRHSNQCSHPSYQDTPTKGYTPLIRPDFRCTEIYSKILVNWPTSKGVITLIRPASL